MNNELVIGLINNTALLMALCIVYELRYLIPVGWNRFLPIINGFLTGVICLAIMTVPFKLASGIVFDTRSILISVTALTFGFVPALICGGMALVYRIVIGGTGALMGSLVIITSAVLGIIWRHLSYKKAKEYSWINVYLFGVVVHIFMLSYTLVMPWPTSGQVLNAIAFPVMIIYPVATVLLVQLLFLQKSRNESMIQISEAKSRYQSLFNNNHTVMFLLDPANGDIIDANPAACDFYGYPLEALKISNISLFKVETTYNPLGEFARFSIEEKIFNVYKHRKKSGEIVDVEIYSGPIVMDGKSLVYSIVHDITERSNLEKMKNEIEAQLRHQQKLEAIGTLAGGVAHEINNPINGIMNYAQLIYDKCEDSSEQALYAKEIIHETERVSTIVKNLLQFSRQEKQSHSYASIYDIINQTVSLINTIIKKDQIQLLIDLDKDLPDLKCRSQQIQQVLMNLLTNARDALNEKYPSYDSDKIIKITSNLQLIDDRRWIELIVEDHGTGIKNELLDKIFVPFFSTKPKDRGTGLGLSISFGIVKDHHGKIDIETAESKFSRFVLSLPVDNGWET